MLLVQSRIESYVAAQNHAFLTRERSELPIKTGGYVLPRKIIDLDQVRMLFVVYLIDVKLS